MAQYFPNAYPVWYQEGFAEYFGATVFNRDGTIDVGRIQMPRLPALSRGAWLSSQQLMNGTVEQLPTYQWDQFYAQGWLLTHYLSAIRPATSIFASTWYSGPGAWRTPKPCRMPSG